MISFIMGIFGDSLYVYWDLLRKRCLFNDLLREIV